MGSTDSDEESCRFEVGASVSDDLQITFLQRLACACREAAMRETDRNLKEEYRRSASSYFSELKQLRVTNRR